MRPVSAGFLRALRGSHQARFEARLVTAGQVGTDPDGTQIDIVAGDVTLDGTAAIRSTVDLTTDGSLWPHTAAGLLAPYGAYELWVRRGIVLGTGTEWVSLGYHRLTGPDQDQAPDGPIKVAAGDRMAGLIDGRVLSPVSFAATATLGDVVAQLVTEVYPTAVIEWDDATNADTLGRAMVCEEDRHAFLADLVTAAAKVWYWDHRGHLVIASPPSTTDPVWTVDAGENGVLVELSRQLSREGVTNIVVATGEGADETPPVRGMAWDNDGRSPTYRYGPFGPVPKFFASPLLTTTAAAVAAARTELTKTLGLPYSVDFSTVPNPALEPYDPVLCEYDDAGPAETHIVQSVAIPLDPQGELKARTRQQSSVLIGQTAL